ncbi:MAG: efflux RND transporter periplasmic adaptor subunit [Acidobacteria bacterium]|nr:efflux RND transporter periplasmic adaptor subunit [Acidobacteriota bacterium]
MSQSRNSALYRPTVALVSALLALISSACGSDYSASAGKAPTGKPAVPAARVKVVRVAQTLIEQTVIVNGGLAAYDHAILSAKVPGRLASIAVDLGSAVRKDEVIASVEPQDYKLRMEQAMAALAGTRARLGLPAEGIDERVDPERTGTVRQASALMDEARANRERIAALFEQGVISRAQLDAAEAGYKVALSRYQDALEEIQNRRALFAQRRSELALAEQQLADTAIRAPFDGIIQERRASPGEYLAAGAPVVALVRTNPLRLRAEVPERAAPSIKPAQRVRVSVEGDPRVYLGRIMRLSPAITDQNRMLMVEADVANEGSLRPGSFVSVEIVVNDAAPAITVPSGAIRSFAGITKVILVQEGKAVERPVTLGKRTDQWTEVLDGLSVGEDVILDPGNLQSGQLVSVVE